MRWHDIRDPGIRLLQQVYPHPRLIHLDDPHLIRKITEQVVCLLVRRALHCDRLARPKQTAQQKQQKIISRSDHDLLRISLHSPCLMQISGNAAPQLQLPLRVAKLKQGAFLFQKHFL